MNGSVDSIISEIMPLPVEIEVCLAFLESVSKHNDSLTDLVKFAALSPSLTYNILNLAHSPFCNNKKNITSLNDALNMIGPDIAVPLIKDILSRSCNSNDYISSETRIESQYYGSLKSAHLSALISEELNLTLPFTAYIAALIHNIGDIALSIRFPIQYNRLKTSENLSYFDQVSVEDHTLGVNHCYLGARMVENWSSFPFIAEALFYHHHSLEKMKQASTLVRLIYFSSMVDNQIGTDYSLIRETGRELFNFSENQVDEYISISELKVQNRLLHLGIEVSDNNSKMVYRPEYQREVLHYNRSGDNSLLAALISNINRINDEKDILDYLGKAIHFLTGFNEIFYFKYKEVNNSLDGLNLSHPENAELSNDFALPLNKSSSIIASSFQMGIDLNSLERVNNTEPALFDLQMINYMGTEGIYCMPLLDNDRTIGIIVFGVTSAGLISSREKISRLRYLTDAIIPLLSNNKIKGISESADNKNTETDSIQTRKLIHEINNPLSAVKNYLKVLSMKLDDINVETDEIRIMDDELNRVTNLLKEFKSSSTDKKIAKTTSSISRIISDTILLIKNSRVNGPAVNIDFEMDENVPDIKIDKDAFRQVLLNLINNSIEAMSNGGNISVNVQYKNGLQHGRQRVVNSEDNGKRIEISVADDGPGIPDQLKPNIFKKQSTTKSDHDGLGLLIVHELVKKMGGNVILDDEAKRGACFKIILPAE